MLLAQSRHLPCARHALDRRVKPQRQKNAWIGRRMAGAAFHSLYACKQRRQVEPFDKSPDHADPMVVLHEFIETDSPQGYLPSLRRAKPRRRRAAAALVRSGAV
ncbi:hypothetical protein GGD83_004956 [Rhodoblastus sphagnicola]|uniref:hypothetical protein n=1 Tax=Rhodoblastus sphagnicola TaxID=333368 RepID=UPI0017AF4311|nr:hypothetical protein [Rhodoblastus sphagnicola]MBB4201118.1 hypothetical protein [Rhodoblastus sphagnicola]